MSVISVILGNQKETFQKQRPCYFVRRQGTAFLFSWSQRLSRVSHKTSVVINSDWCSMIFFKSEFPSLFVFFFFLEWGGGTVFEKPSGYIERLLGGDSWHRAWSVRVHYTSSEPDKFVGECGVVRGANPLNRRVMQEWRRPRCSPQHY